MMYDAHGKHKHCGGKIEARTILGPRGIAECVEYYCTRCKEILEVVYDV